MASADSSMSNSGASSSLNSSAATLNPVGAGGTDSSRTPGAKTGSVVGSWGSDVVAGSDDVLGTGVSVCGSPFGDGEGPLVHASSIVSIGAV